MEERCQKSSCTGHPLRSLLVLALSAPALYLLTSGPVLSLQSHGILPLRLSGYVWLIYGPLNNDVSGPAFRGYLKLCGFKVQPMCAFELEEE